MAYAYGKVNAAAGPEFARCFVGVHKPMAFQDENDFFISVIVDRGSAWRNPSRELGDLFAAEVRIDQVAEQTVLSYANVFAKVFAYQQLRGLARRLWQRTNDDVTLRVLGATRADNTHCLRASVL